MMVVMMMAWCGVVCCLFTIFITWLLAGCEGNIKLLGKSLQELLGWPSVAQATDDGGDLNPLT